MKKTFISMLALLAIATTAQAQENSINGHEYVDLGLPSGLLWATCNVGAEKPEDYGLYFAWGETTGYTGDTSDGRLFDWENYKFVTSDALTKYTGSDKAVLDPDDDAATANWGEGWRMPTFDEIKELLDNTSSVWTTLNGVNGRQFTSNKNGNSIFLPASGGRHGGSLDDVGSCGAYWLSSLNEGFPASACFLYFSSDDAFSYGSMRRDGRSVRPVIPKSIEINATNFPDPNFRSFVSGTAIDKDGNGYLSSEEIAAVQVMGVPAEEIVDMKGIEHFTALEYLYCQRNPLKSLDVSKNIKLKGLYCFYNELTELDVSKNINLTSLTCHRNQISGDKMQALVESLPTVASGEFSVFKLDDEQEKNVITKSQVALANRKGWKVWAYDGEDWSEYAGSDDTPNSIDNSQLAIDDLGNDWYSIDGKKLQGEPTQKGIYILNGKKVVK